MILRTIASTSSINSHGNKYPLQMWFAGFSILSTYVTNSWFLYVLSIGIKKCIYHDLHKTHTGTLHTPHADERTSVSLGRKMGCNVYYIFNVFNEYIYPIIHILIEMIFLFLILLWIFSLYLSIMLFRNLKICFLFSATFEKLTVLIEVKLYNM